jgi:hypothetical protein
MGSDLVKNVGRINNFMVDKAVMQLGNISQPKSNNDFYAQIDNNFKYHAPKEGQPELYTAIRGKAKELAEMIADSCPGGRERSLAITKLEEVVMWANAAIARS